ncbi:MAG: fold metallo-hydrolase [Acidimicrobiaceae bacterium]|nr:fold metallo-hydrolase [Acidimicrobiaceae bacterium]
MTGAPVEIEPGVSRIVANNPLPMTGKGTNSYVIGAVNSIVVDPGPADSAHIDRLLEVTGGSVRYVVITHSHLDHASGARELADRSAAVVLGPPGRGGYRPDAVLSEGDVVAVPGWRLQPLHTPGHSADHLCYVLDRVPAPGRDPATESGPAPARLHPPRRLLFSGDHVLGGTTTVVAAPEGDMTAYLESLDRVLRLDPAVDLIAPGHGEPMSSPRTVLESYIAHRLQREAQVLELLAALGPVTIGDLAAAVYPMLAVGLVDASRLQVWAHLRKLGVEGRARSADPDDPGASWTTA